jgi:hypothetical protein
MKVHVATLSILLCVFCSTKATAQTRRAPLLDINTYGPAGTMAQHPEGCTCAPIRNGIGVMTFRRIPKESPK